MQLMFRQKGAPSVKLVDPEIFGTLEEAATEAPRIARKWYRERGASS